MTRSERRLGHIAVPALVELAIFLLPLAANAQAQSSGSDLAPRVGPNAVPQQLPAYPSTKSIIPQANSAQTTSGAPIGQTINFATVSIVKEGARDGVAVARERVSISGVYKITAEKGAKLDAAWVQAQFAENRMMGRAVDVADVMGLILALNKVYLEEGYINSGLLLQDKWPEGGEALRLRLIMGGVSRRGDGKADVKVEWPTRTDTKGSVVPVRKGLSDTYVLNRMAAANPIPLNERDLESQFRLLADNPAIETVNAKLMPGDKPGTATVALQVVPAPRFDLYFDVANSRSPSIGGYRSAVGGTMRNFLVAGSIAAFEAGSTSGADDYAFNYEAPLGTRNAVHMRLQSDQAAVVDPTVRALDIRSHDREGEIGVRRTIIDTPLYPLPAKRGWVAAQTLSFDVTLARNVSDTFLLGMPFSFSPGSVDGHSRYSVIRGSMDWMTRGPRQVMSVAVIGSVGLNGTGGIDPEIHTTNPHFKVLLTQFNFAQRLNDGSMEFRARASAQFTGDMLYSSERISAGGAATVRGYRENLILGDTGAIASAELACALSARNFCGPVSTSDHALRVAGFVDAAMVRDHYGPQPEPDAIYSVGASVDWPVLRGLNFHSTFAVPLRKAMIVGKKDLQDRGLSFELSFHPLAALSH